MCILTSFFLKLWILQNLYEFSYENINVDGMSAVRITKTGNIVSLMIDAKTFMRLKYTPQNTYLFTVSPQFRPKTNILFGTITSYNNTPISYPLSIDVNGNVAVYGPIATALENAAYYGLLTYTI